MSVTIAQARQAGTGKFASQPERRVETENRGVRVRGLASDTQEAVIQQEFEKLAPVRRVNYVAGSSEAVVLLENPAVRPSRSLSSSSRPRRERMLTLSLLLARRTSARSSCSASRSSSAASR